MDPHTFIKVSISALALRIPVASKPAMSRVHSTSSPCFCEIKLLNAPTQTAPLPLLPLNSPAPDSRSIAATFYLNETAFQKPPTTSWMGTTRTSKPCLEVRVYSGRQGRSCGIGNGKQLGKVCIGVNVEWKGSSPVEVHNGWVCIGKRKAGELHLNVKAESDPRYVFQFHGQPEVSPQILQIQGRIHQPIFSCKFSRDRGCRSRTNLQDCSINARATEKEKKDRKGWLIIIHDLSGSPVAAASMVTPFVPSAGTDRVSRSNPGAWLILRPGPRGEDSWLPWGRLEAWRERGSKGKIGCKFKPMEEGGGLSGIDSSKILLSETVINCHKGSGNNVCMNMELPLQGGFIMSTTTVKGEGKSKCSTNKLQVELAMRHVSCVEDAAVFMALAASVDLSVDACQPFKRTLRPDLIFSPPFL
eukprot:Gb_07943 [translate_table: standard]